MLRAATADSVDVLVTVQAATPVEATAVQAALRTAIANDVYPSRLTTAGALPPPVAQRVAFRRQLQFTAVCHATRARPTSCINETSVAPPGRNEDKAARSHEVAAAALSYTCCKSFEAIEQLPTA